MPALRHRPHVINNLGMRAATGGKCVWKNRERRKRPIRYGCPVTCRSASAVHSQMSGILRVSIFWIISKCTLHLARSIRLPTTHRGSRRCAGVQEWERMYAKARDPPLLRLHRHPPKHRCAGEGKNIRRSTRSSSAAPAKGLVCRGGKEYRQKYAVLLGRTRAATRQCTGVHGRERYIRKSTRSSFAIPASPPANAQREFVFLCLPDGQKTDCRDYGIAGIP